MASQSNSTVYLIRDPLNSNSASESFILMLHYAPPPSKSNYHIISLMTPRAHGPSLPIPCGNPFQLTWILYPTFANAFPPSLQPHPQQLNALPTPSQHLNPLNHTLKRLMCVCLSREVSAQVEQSETIDSEINPSSTDPLCCLDALNM